MRHHHRTLTAIVTCLLTSAAACDDADTTDPPDTGAAEGRLTWSEDIAPIMEQNCTSCHIEGGAAPFALDTHESLETYGALALDSMEAGRMPPWSPDPECRPIVDERVMDPADISRFGTWLEEGSLKGPAVAATRSEAVAFEPTHEIKIGAPYTPTLGESDDYRCFVLDLDFDTTMYLRGATVRPGNGLVHHALVYALDAEQATEALERDATDPVEGYTCFGGPIEFGAIEGGAGSVDLSSLGGFSFPNQIGAWVPGQQGKALDKGAIRIDEGSVVVMQIHYSAIAGEPIADADTTFLAMLSTQEPEFLLRTTPVAQRVLDIPAGDADVEASITLPYYSDEDLQIASMTGHMHLLGKGLRAEVTRADGANECGLSIPDWDFDWQESYTFAQRDQVTMRDGDTLTLTCAYDNSMANQPVVNGVQQDPRDVEWGDGTLDEMCLLYLGVTEPFAPDEDESGPECSQACVAECGGDLACLTRCEDDDLGCFSCAFGVARECAPSSCLGELLSVQSCLRPCISASIMLGGNLGACMEGQCGDRYAGAATCLTDALSAPECEAPLGTCGL